MSVNELTRQFACFYSIKITCVREEMYWRIAILLTVLHITDAAVQSNPIVTNTACCNFTDGSNGQCTTTSQCEDGVNAKHCFARVNYVTSQLESVFSHHSVSSLFIQKQLRYIVTAGYLFTHYTMDGDTPKAIESKSHGGCFVNSNIDCEPNCTLRHHGASKTSDVRFCNC